MQSFCRTVPSTYQHHTFLWKGDTNISICSFVNFKQMGQVLYKGALWYHVTISQDDKSYSVKINVHFLDGPPGTTTNASLTGDFEWRHHLQNEQGKVIIGRWMYAFNRLFMRIPEWVGLGRTLISFHLVYLLLQMFFLHVNSFVPRNFIRDLSGTQAPAQLNYCFLPVPADWE